MFVELTAFMKWVAEVRMTTIVISECLSPPSDPEGHRRYGGQVCTVLFRTCVESEECCISIGGNLQNFSCL